ncbi:MAG: hypothetical protein JWO93_2062 [Micrococcaceae bacterium]|nr:hypothetical protein [Micrococcaceae bacterium]
MLNTNTVIMPSGEGGWLDWIILGGASLSIGGVAIYRVLAVWRGWWSDDQ